VAAARSLAYLPAAWRYRRLVRPGVVVRGRWLPVIMVAILPVAPAGLVSGIGAHSAVSLNISTNLGCGHHISRFQWRDQRYVVYQPGVERILLSKEKGRAPCGTRPLPAVMMARPYAIFNAPRSTSLASIDPMRPSSCALATVIPDHSFSNSL
jgi:hypothetical protein